ncbi:MAG: hypothetical protein HYZ72_15595 [Deltaproteobacteria bacterium]|nr:hypothetical protein [Deltaproteobacteria bacterium]
MTSSPTLERFSIGFTSLRGAEEPFALSVAASAAESKSVDACVNCASLRLRCATLRPNGVFAVIEWLQANENCSSGNLAHAAVRLGIHRVTLYRKLKRYGLA